MNNGTAAAHRGGGTVRAIVRAVLDVRLGRLLKWGGLLAALLLLIGIIGFALFVLLPAHNIPAYEPVDEYVYLDQGWGTQREAAPRQTYYYTGQGTSLPQGNALHPLRYSWFVNLEMPFGQERFAAPEHMRAYRFLVDPAPTPANPDQLPVGFARHFSTVVNEYVLDITCATCHTGQLHYTKDGKRYAVRIDGGQAMHAFTDMGRGSFGPTLVASLLATYANPAKFKRFARKVLGDGYPDGKSRLHAELWHTVTAFATIGQDNPLRHLYPVREGFGRTDALGRIANTVFGDHLTPGNYHEATAPVSYPFVWNIWKFDWVQYNASVSQPLSRNIGEALGVGAVIDLLDANGRPIPLEERYTSSVRVRELVAIEHTLQQLTPPVWPEAIFGRVDRARAASGKKLFEERCRRCHGPHPVDPFEQAAQAPGKTEPGIQWRMKVLPVERIGTDPTAAVGFVERHYDLSAAGISDAEVRAVLKPILTRQLIRDVRYRLQSLVASGEADEFEALLAAYPDPNAEPVPRIDASSFAAIAAALAPRAGELPDLAQREPPKRPMECALICQLVWLSWDVRFGEAYIAARLDGIDVTRVTEGEGLNIIGILIKNKYYRDHDVSYRQQQCLEGFGTLDLPQQIAGYKPRPLQGVWATPPFLHNGSVPTLYQMLVPPEQRDKRFFVGRRDYDPVHVGYVTQPLAEDEDDGFWLDTSVIGNHNTGHAFVADPQSWQRFRDDPEAHPLPPGVIGPEMSDDERLAIIEYLKIHVDEPLTPEGFEPPNCFL